MGTLATADTAALVDILRDPDADLVLRAIAAMYAAGTREQRGTHVRRRSRCDGIWQVLLDMGAPASLVAATEVNHRRTGYPLALWASLFHLVRREGYVTDHHCPKRRPRRASRSTPSITTPGPARRPSASGALRAAALGRYPLRGAQIGVFYGEGGLVRPQFQCDWSGRLYALGTEAEMASAGLTADECSQVLKIVENELPTLHEIRRRFDPARRFADAGGPVWSGGAIEQRRRR